MPADIPAVPATATDASVQTPSVEKAQTATPQTVAVPLADFQRLQEEVATLQQLNKKAQSERDQIKAQISKSFQRKLKSVDELKDDEGWDAAEVARRKQQYANEHALKLLEADAETPVSAPSVVTPPPLGVTTADEAKQGLTRYLSGFDLTVQDVDIAPFLRQVTSPEEVATMDKQLHAAVRKAIEAKAAKVGQTATALLAQQEATRIKEELETHGGIGGVTNTGGAPAPTTHRNKATLNPPADLYELLHSDAYGGGKRRG